MTVTKQVVWTATPGVTAATSLGAAVDALAQNQQAREAMSRVSELLDAAKRAADGGRLGEAESSLHEALALLHAAQAEPPPTAAGVVRVGGTIKEPRKLRDVVPVYPQAAHDAGLQGVVIIEATIDRDGSVVDATVLRGVEGLNDAALDAVRQWVYTPTILSGVPVAVRMTVTVVFSIK